MASGGGVLVLSSFFPIPTDPRSLVESKFFGFHVDILNFPYLVISCCADVALTFRELSRSSLSLFVFSLSVCLLLSVFSLLE
jgi:hypothetical protein